MQEAPALRNLALDSLRLDGGGTAQRPGSAPPQVDDDVPPGAAQHPPSHLAASQQRPLAHGVGVGAGLSPLGGDAGPSGHEAGSQHHAGIGTSTLAPRRTLAGAASGGLSALNDALARDTSYLSDPEYVRYYYANRNINPRLPPPSARADWGGSGSTFGKAGDDVSSVGALGGHDTHAAALNLLFGSQLALKDLPGGGRSGSARGTHHDHDAPSAFLGSPWARGGSNNGGVGGMADAAAAAAAATSTVAAAAAALGVPSLMDGLRAGNSSLGGSSAVGSPAQHATGLYSLSLASGVDDGSGSAAGSQPLTPHGGLFEGVVSSPRLGSEASEGPSSQDPQVAINGTHNRQRLLEFGRSSLRMDRIPRSAAATEQPLRRASRMAGSEPAARMSGTGGHDAADLAPAAHLDDLLGSGVELGGGGGSSGGGSGRMMLPDDVAGLLPGMGFDDGAGMGLEHDGRMGEMGLDGGMGCMGLDSSMGGMGLDGSMGACAHDVAAAVLGSAVGGMGPSMQQMQMHYMAAMYPYYAQQALQMQAMAGYPHMLPPGLPPLPGMMLPPGMMPPGMPGGADMGAAGLCAPMPGMPGMPPGLPGCFQVPGGFHHDAIAAAYYAAAMPGLASPPAHGIGGGSGGGSGGARGAPPPGVRSSSDGGIARGGGAATTHPFGGGGGGGNSGGRRAMDVTERSPRDGGGSGGGGMHPTSPAARQRGERGGDRDRGGGDRDRERDRDGRDGRGSSRRGSGPRHGDAHRPVDSLLEEFKTNKSRRFELSDILGHVFEFSMDQHGSRFIQQRLEGAPPPVVGSVVAEVLPRVSQLMSDVFGNYVVQKLLEHGSDEHRSALVEKGLAGGVLQLSMQMYGCRVVQKALETLPVDGQCAIVAELDGHIMRCVRDQNGNHVVQKIIECLPTDHISSLLDSFLTCVVPLSSHPFGCRVIQRILEHCHDKRRRGVVLDEILKAAASLSQDQYGNYVTQHVLEHGSPAERLRAVHVLAPDVVPLSMHKFASNVVEKCLTNSGAAERDLLLKHMLADGSGGSGGSDPDAPINQMMKDQYGNYVVQKVLEVVDYAQCDMLLVKVRTQLAALRKLSYGKHIVTRVEKLLATGVRLQGVRAAAAGSGAGAPAPGSSSPERSVVVGVNGRIDTVSGSGLPYDDDIKVLREQKAENEGGDGAGVPAGAGGRGAAGLLGTPEDAAAPVTPTRKSASPIASSGGADGGLAPAPVHA